MITGRASFFAPLPGVLRISNRLVLAIVGAALLVGGHCPSGSSSPDFRSNNLCSHGQRLDHCIRLPALDRRGKHAIACAAVDFERARAVGVNTAPRMPAPAAINAFTLHSRPSATKIIYLDFDGAVTQNTPWNGGSNPRIVTTAFDMDSNPGSFSAAELAAIIEIWQRVSEIYSPFNVDVTTQAPAIADLLDTGGNDTKWGIRVLFGASNPSPAPGAGGVAYIGSFGWDVGTGVDTPCFVLQQGVGTVPKYNADAASHEIGHTVGLRHDGLYPASDSRHVEYYEGQGTGNVAWAPNMGAGYYVPLVQWSKGEYANPSNTENDLNIITTQNGFNFRVDDYASTRTTARAIPGTANGNSFQVSVSGVVEFRSDEDWFQINCASGNIVLNAVGGPANTMLDIHLSLFDSGGALISDANPLNDVIASLTKTVTGGTYYVRIKGTGLGNPLTTGYTDYSSIGQYTITGSYPVSAGAPALTGASNQFYGVKQPAKYVNTGITITDPDSTRLASATVVINNYVSGQDILNLNVNPATMGNIAASFNSTTGKLTLTSAGSTATLAQFQTALRTVTYFNPSSTPTMTPRIINFQVYDGANYSNNLTTTISFGYRYVTASYNATTKTLTLGDDLDDNSVTVAVSGNQLTVTGILPTKIGTAASSQTSVSFPYSGSVNLNVNFTAGGSDTVTVNTALMPAAIFNMGNGNDTVKLNFCNITRLSVDGGNGTDAVLTNGCTIGSSTYVSVP